jgi:hypothetical protein
MKTEIQAKIYKEIKDLSSSERVAYFKEKSRNSALWQRLVARDHTRKQGSIQKGKV